jgi:hypothetical protein
MALYCTNAQMCHVTHWHASAIRRSGSPSITSNFAPTFLPVAMRKEEAGAVATQEA